MALLDIQNLHVYYGHIHALKGINLHVNEGEIVTLIGSNGAGKTTTLRAISNLLKTPEATHVMYNGCLLYTSPSPRDRTRYRMPSSA